MQKVVKLDILKKLFIYNILDVSMGKILLYYKYVQITYPKQLLKWQQKICTELGLTGRIIVGHEGINGTVGGSDLSIDRYTTIMRSDSLFSDVDFKSSEGDASCFPRLQIKVRDEIVRLGIDPKAVTAQNGGQHLKPQEVHELLGQQPKDLVILDARNQCESNIGAFTGAIKPEIVHFRELPGYIDQNIDLFKDKDVLMYCTGGIRCERASAYLKSKGVTKTVYQVEGGIHRYIEQYPEGHFKGKNYVFDARIAVKANEQLLGSCALCTVSCDEYTNCLNAACNKHFICCAVCKNTYANTCSANCKVLVDSASVALRPPLHVVFPISPQSSE
jgi:predicted sulfurtransferase